ncbi:MAG: phosphoenolpyruvate--protein phosphotransferase [Thermoprotei archaeon]
MKKYKGLVASEGIALGKAFLYEVADVLNNVPDNCKVEDTGREIKRLTKALEDYKAYLKALEDALPRSEKELIEAYNLMAEALIDEATDLVKKEKICAELAVKITYEKYSRMFRESGSELIALRETDLKSIASGIVESITRAEKTKTTIAQIVLADELYPIDVIRLARQDIKGIVTRRGGLTSHVAIIARNNGIPYVIVPDLSKEAIKALNGKTVVVDAVNGILIAEPTRDIVNIYIEKLNRYKDLMKKAEKYICVKARTIDEYEISVLCNVGNVEEARLATTRGCDGIGLFRVEFLYLGEKPPSEETLRSIFIKLSEFFPDKPVVIRAPDLGADKPVTYIKLEETNPFLGLRGIRLLLEYSKELFRPFLKAYLSVAKHSKNLKLLLPMVSKVREVYEVINEISYVERELGITDAIKKISLGIMVETPASALMLDKIAETGYIDFISIGTNDLTQYVLAVDRTNARLGKYYSEFDPSVLRLLKMIIETGKTHNLEVEVCGEMASRQLAVPLLIGMGVDGLSVNPPVVGVIKYTISKLSKDLVAKELIDKILSLKDECEVIENIKNYLVKHGLEII